MDRKMSATAVEWFTSDPVQLMSIHKVPFDLVSEKILFSKKQSFCKVFIG